jgi:hypothetical protein
LALEQDFLHVVAVPAGEQSSAGDARLAGLVLLEEIERDVAENREVLRGVVFALATLIFARCRVRNPV